MEVIDAIRLAHRIDQDLGRMSGAVGEELRDRVVRIQTEWRDVAYAVSANLCGVAMCEEAAVMPRRRRRRKAEDGASAPDPAEADSSAPGGGR
jgi:hypothetical protein